MKKNLKFICFFAAIVVMTLIFAVPSFAETETFSVGDYGIVSIEVPNGATVTAWSGTPYGYFGFEDASVSGNTYSTGFTANLPGTATIRATVKYADNTTEFVTVKTYLNVLTNGIYTVGNDYADSHYSSSGEFYLRSQITYPTSSGLYVAQHSQNNFGDMSNKIYNYWRVTSLGSEQYTIQSVADENKYLSYSGSTLSLANVEGSVTTAEKWYIRGEMIIPVSSSAKCLILSSSTPSGTYYDVGTPYYYFNLSVNTVGYMEFENWSFTKENIKGVLFTINESGKFKTTFTKEYNIDNGTVDFSEHGYGIKTYHFADCPPPTLRWSSSKSSVATVNANTGKLTLRGAGRAVITVTATFAPSEQATASYILDVVLVDDGKYFLKAYSNKLYAGIQNGIISNGNEIEQQNFDEDNLQIWVFTHVGNNEFIISPSFSSSYYLGVENDSATSGADIVLRSGTITDGMRWKIQEGRKGKKIVSCLDSAENLVLMTNSDSTTVGEKLILGIYTNDTNYCDEWSLPDFYDITLVALPEAYDRSSYFGDIADTMYTIGYTDCYNNHSTVSDGISRDRLVGLMERSRITLVRTHGFKTSISLSDDELLTRSYLLNLPQNSLQYSDLVIYGACLTGNTKDDSDNLVNATVSAGARTVIGFEYSVHYEACNEWCENFFIFYKQAYNSGVINYDTVINQTIESVLSNPYAYYTKSNGEIVSVIHCSIEGDSIVLVNE